MYAVPRTPSLAGTGQSGEAVGSRQVWESLILAPSSEGRPPASRSATPARYNGAGDADRIGLPLPS